MLNVTVSGAVQVDVVVGYKAGTGPIFKPKVKSLRPIKVKTPPGKPPTALERFELSVKPVVGINVYQISKKDKGGGGKGRRQLRVCNCDTKTNYRKQRCTSKKSGNAIACTHGNSDGKHRCIESPQTKTLSKKCVSTCATKTAWRDAPCAPAGGTTTNAPTTVKPTKAPTTKKPTTKVPTTKAPTKALTKCALALPGNCCPGLTISPPPPPPPGPRVNGPSAQNFLSLTPTLGSPRVCRAPSKAPTKAPTKCALALPGNCCCPGMTIFPPPPPVSTGRLRGAFVSLTALASRLQGP